jgi:hypothetical protein
MLHHQLTFPKILWSHRMVRRSRGRYGRYNLRFKRCTFFLFWANFDNWASLWLIRLIGCTDLSNKYMGIILTILSASICLAHFEETSDGAIHRSRLYDWRLGTLYYTLIILARQICFLLDLTPLIVLSLFLVEHHLFKWADFRFRAIVIQPLLRRLISQRLNRSIWRMLYCVHTNSRSSLVGLISFLHLEWSFFIGIVHHL